MQFDDVAAIARRQHGLLTYEQAMDRALRIGGWLIVYMTNRTTTCSKRVLGRDNGAVPDAPPFDPAPLDPAPVEQTHDQESRRRARTWWFAFAAVALVAVAGMMWLGRQSTSDVPPAPKAFCKAAEQYEKELARQQEAYERDVARQISFVEDIAATAPKAVRADAQVFLDSLRAIEAAPDEETRRRLQDDPEVKESVDNVNRRWNHGCGVFDRQSGI